MPHFFRHFAPLIASKLSLSRPSRTSFVPVRAAKAHPNWSSSGAGYDSAASRGGKDDYIELGETTNNNDAWRRGGVQPTATIVQLERGEAAVPVPVQAPLRRGRDDVRRGPVAHLPSNVTSVYSDDYPRV